MSWAVLLTIAYLKWGLGPKNITNIKYAFTAYSKGGARGVRLSVDSTTFLLFFYNLQPKFEQNLHLQRNSEIYNLQFWQNALKYLNNQKEYLQTGFNWTVMGATWVQVNNNNKDKITTRFWIKYSVLTISIATSMSVYNLQVFEAKTYQQIYKNS